MSALRELSRRAQGFLTDFLCARDGANALEFSIIAVPFLFLLLATLELTVIFVANTNLQNATFFAARQLRVGEVMASGLAATSSSGKQLDQNDFKAAICKNMQFMSAEDCAANLYLDVRELSGFTGTTAPDPYSGTTLNTGSFCFYSGTSGSVVELRAYYLWPVFTPIMLNMLVNTTAVAGAQPQSGNWFALSSHEVFRVEPGVSGSNTGASC